MKDHADSRAAQNPHVPYGLVGMSATTGNECLKENWETRTSPSCIRSTRAVADLQSSWRCQSRFANDHKSFIVIAKRIAGPLRYTVLLVGEQQHNVTPLESRQDRHRTTMDN